MQGIFDKELSDKACNCNARSLMEDGRYMYDSNCRRSMIVYELKCTCCDMSYIGNTQLYLKDRTQQHMHDVWKVIECGRIKCGQDWKGSGGYTKCDAFAKHFAEHCRDEPNSNAVKARLKQIMVPTNIWQGDRNR